MKVESKMNYVIKRVLGEGYSIMILNDNEYQILVQGHIAAHSESMNNLISHWREAISKGIDVIIKAKLKAALNEI
jgi:hypothetical protein